MTIKEQWFAEWFNSPYYHILYKDRDESEACFLMDNLVEFLKPEKDSKMLDVACGKGRHALYLNKKGFDVTGIDLSSESIQHARVFENDRLNFFVHDMRETFKENYFDYIFNLFTSFGYFENEQDNFNVIKAVDESLKKNGVFVIDFFNSLKTIKTLVNDEVKVVDDIKFHISRKLENGFIVKSISFYDNDKQHTYIEKVQALTLEDFTKYLSFHHLKIINLFGNYKLHAFDEQNSERLIIICKKM